MKEVLQYYTRDDGFSFTVGLFDQLGHSTYFLHFTSLTFTMKIIISVCFVT